MDRLQELPTELHLLILSYISKADQKTYRCVSRACRECVSSLLFANVSFDFDEGGLTRLEAISADPKLALLVREVTLRRRRNFRSFCDKHDFARATVYEYIEWAVDPSSEENYWNDPLDWDDEDDWSGPYDLSTTPIARWPGGWQNEVEDGAMSLKEWQSLTVQDVRQLSEEWDEACRAARNRMVTKASVLASRIFKLPPPESGVEIDGMVSRLASILRRLPDVLRFNHTLWPRSSPEATRWRRVQFHPDALDLFTDAEFEEIDEHLHLLLAMHATALHGGHIPWFGVCLTGYAFVVTLQICHVVIWEIDHVTALEQSIPGRSDLMAFIVRGWITRGMSGRDISQWLEVATRSLVAIDESVFTQATQLTLHLSTHDGVLSNNTTSAAKCLRRWIQQGLNLSQLRLRFHSIHQFALERHLPHYVQAWRNTQDEGWILRRPMQEMMEVVSSEIRPALAASPSISRLRSLDLSMVISGEDLRWLISQVRQLRHLKLTHVSLKSKTVKWETIFQGIARDLRLETVEVSALSDIHRDRRRRLLRPLDAVWDDAEDGCYEWYARGIRDFLLRRSTDLAPLCPEEYRQRLAELACQAIGLRRGGCRGSIGIEMGDVAASLVSDIRHHQKFRNQI